jgi:uncharacterized membrane protein YbhN (UPF0104 family)
MQPIWRNLLTASAFVAITVFTVWQLGHQFGHISFADVGQSIQGQQPWQIGASIFLTALSFLCLALYDVMGAHIVAPKRVPPLVALLAGGAANAVSNTLGFHAFTGSFLRARIFRRYGLSLAEVARLVSLSWLALGLGFLAMLTIAQVAQVAQAIGSAQPAIALAIAGFIATGLALFVVWLRHGPRELRVFGFTQPLPSATMAVVQMALGAVESAAAIGALYVLLPPDLAPSFPLFAVGYISAVALGLLANVPGGLGVFEASITALVLGAGRADLLAALLLYRMVYNILPFVVSASALGLLHLASPKIQLEGG